MRSLTGGESASDDDERTHDLLDPILQRSGRLERTLRYFIARDAIEFAVQEPDVYRAVIQRTKRNLAQYTVSPSASPKPRLLNAGSNASGSSLSQCSHRTEGDTDLGVRRRFSYASRKSQNTRSFSNNDIELNAVIPEERTVFRSGRSLLVTVASCLLTFRSFTAAQKLGMIWGGYGVLIPYAFVSVFFTCPLLCLELALGNMVRGGLNKMLFSATPSLRLLAPVTVFGLIIILGTNAMYVSESFTILRESIKGRPGWLARQAITLDCEQTRPAIESCVKKAGCIFLENVCKIDPVYWARAHLLSLSSHWQTGAVTSLVTWGCVLLLQVLRLKPITTFVGTSTFLGLIALFYLCYQETAQIQAETSHLVQHPSLMVISQTVSYSLTELGQTALWLTMSHQSLRSVGVGMGLNPLMASLAPAGTNVIKAAILLTVIDVAATAGFVAVNHALLQNLASTNGQSIYAIMKDMPDLIEVVLPATVGNVSHKKFVLALIVGSAIVAQIASTSIQCYCFAQMLLDTRTVQRLRLGRVACTCLVALTGFAVTLGFIWYPTFEVEHAAIRDIFVIVAYLETLAFGWLKYLPEQRARIGGPAAYGMMILFTAFLSFGSVVGLPILRTLPHARLPWTYTLLPMGLCLALGTLIMTVSLPLMTLSAYRFSMRHPRRSPVASADEEEKTEPRTCTSEFSIAVMTRHRSSTAGVASDDRVNVKWNRLKRAMWWTLLGNIELLRFDLNSALTGRSAFRLELFWSLSIKYLSPFWLLLLIFHDAADSDGTISGNIPFKYPVTSEILERTAITFTNGTQLIPGYFFSVVLVTASISLVALCAVTIRGKSRISNGEDAFRMTPDWTVLPRPVEADGLKLSWASLNLFFFSEFSDGREGSTADEIARPYSTMASTDANGSAAAAECGRFIEAARSASLRDGVDPRIYKRLSTAIFHKALKQRVEDAEQIADRLMKERQLSFSVTALCEEGNDPPQ